VKNVSSTPSRSTITTYLPMTRSALIGELLELIAAIERRVPQVQRAGETSIARDAEALKATALKRIAELEREATPAGVA
jgi:hypothetical protein